MLLLPTAPDNSGGNQRELKHQPLITSTVAQENLPASFDYSLVQYAGGGVWPEQSLAGLTDQYHVHHPADVVRDHHWIDTLALSTDQAPAEAAAVYNTWVSGNSARNRHEVSYHPEVLAGPAEGRQSASQDFCIPFSISVPSRSTRISRADSGSSYAPRPTEANEASPPAGQALEQPVSTKDISTQVASSSSASRPRAASSKKQSFSMAPAPQVRARRSDDGYAAQTDRKASPDSARPEISPASLNDDNVKGDQRTRDHLTSAFVIGEKGNGGMRRTILRKNQLDAFDFSGLPAEKSFPIQIGSEIFRLSGASIMSDGQSDLGMRLRLSPSC